MNRRTNILARLRRRRSRVGHAMLALFASASLAAGATPCPAMSGPAAATTESIPSHDHASMAGHEHAHGGASHHGHGGAEQVALAAHRHVHDAPPTHPTEHPLGHCPHCPQSALLTHSGDASHRLCALDDATANAHSGALQSPLLYVLPQPPVEFAVSLLLRPPDIPFARIVRAHSRVALNLQHCVFLI
jgi:hypothetical protein